MRPAIQANGIPAESPENAKLSPKDDSASNHSYQEFVPLDPRVLTTRPNYVVSYFVNGSWRDIKSTYDREAALAFAIEIGGEVKVTEFKC